MEMEIIAMITALHLENYKSFKNLNLELKKGNNPKKIVAIYGENGSGKSNIVSAFQNLIASLQTVRKQAQITNIQAQAFENEKDSDSRPNLLLEILKHGRIDNAELLDVFENTYMLETNDPMVIKYDFNIDGHDGYYELIFKKNNEKPYLFSEKLYYLIKKASGVVFEVTNNGTEEPIRMWSPNLFRNKEIKNIVDDATLRLWGKHTFLSIFNNILEQTNKEYIKSNVSSNFLDVNRNFNMIAYKSDDSTSMNMFNLLLQDMIKGVVLNNESEINKIKTTEIALSKYFAPMYSDIFKIYYKTVEADKSTIRYELFEQKRIAGKLLEVPFRLESNGTMKLLKLFPLFLNAVHGETVVIDEIDQGIHDLLVDRLIDNIKDDIEGQLIFTTHDTQVMKELDVSSLYVIQIDDKGNKKVVNLSKNGGSNIAAHNNIQKKYLEGYFSGIPYLADVDFYDILNDLEVH